VKNSPSSFTAAAKAVDIVGVACGRGLKDERCRQGPEALRRFGLVECLQAKDIPATWRDRFEAAPASSGVPAMAAIADLSTHLANRASEIVRRGRRLAVVGGDHSIAVGTWRGVAQALRPKGALGLVWIDAHMDSHVPETTPSGNIHGMPLAALLGMGDPSLVSAGPDGPALDPRYVSLVGVRSFEREEAELLQRLGVRIHLMDEVKQRGLGAVLDEAVERASVGTAGFGLSLDLDSIDPTHAPGVSTPVRGGLDAGELLPAFGRIGRRPNLVAMEVVEFNPARDRGDSTARLVCDLLGEVFSTEVSDDEPGRSGTDLRRA
jgi:arginase